MGFAGDEPVSVAALYVTDKFAWLGFGATREAYRGRGGQSALFAERLTGRGGPWVPAGVHGDGRGLPRRSQSVVPQHDPGWLPARLPPPELGPTKSLTD